MIKRIIILFSIFLSGHVKAGDQFDRGVLRVLSETNQQKVIPPVRSLCLPFTGNAEGEKKPSSQDMNDCVRALCGTPSENKSVFLTNANFDQYITPELKKQLSRLEPKLKKLLEIEKQKKLKRLGEIEAKLKNPDLSKLTTELHRSLSYKMFSPYLVEKIDLKKPIEDRITIELKDISQLPPEFKSELTKYKDQYLPYVKSNVEKFLERGLYSATEQKQLFKDRLSKMQQAFDSVSAKMSKFEQEDIPKRIQSFHDEIDSPENPDFSLTMLNIANLEGQINYNLKENKLGFEQPDCNSDKCNDFLKKYIKESDLLPSVQKSKEAIAQNKNDAQSMNQCKSHLVSKLSIISDKKKAEQLVDEVKQMMSKNVFSKFSAHSRKLLEDYFKKNIVTSNKSLISYLSPESPFEKLNQVYDSQLQNKDELFPTSDEMAIIEAGNISEEKLNSSDISNLCAGDFNSNAYDAYVAWAKVKELPAEVKKLVSKLPPKDHIFISPFSCHHDLRGKSVVAHELGHAINQIFASQKLSTESAKSYKTIRKCATDNYTEFIPDAVLFVHEGDALRTEEDTADLFAFMAYPSQDDLFQCALIKPTMDNQNYDELSFLNDDGDSHSTALNRLIMEAINKEKPLPLSCERALEKSKDQLRLKKCVP